MNSEQNKTAVLVYSVEMMAAMIAYALGLWGLNVWFDESDPNYWLILLPVVPFLYVALAIIRFVNKMDELMRKKMIEAMAFSGLATGFSCFTYLFLEGAGLPDFQPEWAYYAMFVYWGIGYLWFKRRYG